MDLANTLREERKTAELQHLEKKFYYEVGGYLANIEEELSKIKDLYSVEAQILQDCLKSEKSCVRKLIDQRMRKILRKAVRAANSTSREDAFKEMTEEEEKIYSHMLSIIMEGKESILSHVNRTERPLTGKKDINEEYEIVRLLDSVPMFVGVNGKNYLLSKDDVVALPAIHAKNLREKNLADQVKFER